MSHRYKDVCYSLKLVCHKCSIVFHFSELFYKVKTIVMLRRLEITKIIITGVLALLSVCLKAFQI